MTSSGAKDADSGVVLERGEYAASTFQTVIPQKLVSRIVRTVMIENAPFVNTEMTYVTAFLPVT